MATRVYMTSRDHGERLVGPLLGDWDAGHSTRDKRGDTHWTKLLDASKTGGGVAVTTSSVVTNGNIDGTDDASIPVLNQLGTARWATRPFASGGTLSGTLTVCYRVRNNDFASLAEIYGQCYAYITNGRGPDLTLRNVVINNLIDGTNWTATQTYRTMVYNITGSVAFNAGDRLVVEVGANCFLATTPPVGTNVFTTCWGTTDAALTPYADAANGDTAFRAAWMELSSNVTFESAPAAPANDACLDALAITSIPYTSSAIDTTESTDTARRVWWTWTADRTGRMLVSLNGSNYSIFVTVMTGTCAGLSTVRSNTTFAWIGRGQAQTWFDAVEGTTYFFRVGTDMTTTAGNDTQVIAPNSGGSCVFSLYEYAAPLDGDLFVSCQYINVYRDGRLINFNDALYGDTPTNSCIDYTLRPMNDFNTAPPYSGFNTSRRLFVDLFGDFPAVHIFDLETLNLGEGRIDVIDAPLNYVGHSENLASIVMDESGRLIMGYFGDNYSVINGTSTPDQCRVNRIDATHADNQDGNPWADADAFTVEQDVGGSSYVDLSSDQATLFYTSSGREVKTYNLSTSTQGPDFATLPVQGVDVPRPGARGVRLLSPYDGSGGMLVTYGNCVHKLSSSGAVIGTYTPSLTAQAQDLDKVELTPDGASAWVSDQYSTYMFRFTVDTMTEETFFPTWLPPGQLSGFTVLGYRGAPANPFTIETEHRIIRRQRTTPIISANGVRLLHKMCEVDLRVGVGLSTGQGSNPLVIFQTSRDGGVTWSDERFASAGAMGRYLRRVMFWQNGQGRSVAYRITVSDPVAWQVVALYIDLQECLS